MGGRDIIGGGIERSSLVGEGAGDLLVGDGGTYYRGARLEGWR